MLFDSEPINATLSAGLATAKPVPFSRARHLFVSGTTLYWAVLSVSGSAPGILQSTDGGNSWTVADSGYSLPDADHIRMDTLGDVLYMACQIGTAVVVVTFDMATGAYTSTSPTLTIAGATVDQGFQDHIALAVDSSGVAYLFCSFLDVSDFTAGPLAYYRLIAGAWDSVFTVLDSQAVDMGREAINLRDSAGAVHLFYRHMDSNDGVHFDTELRHVKIGGSPSTIDSLISGGHSADLFDAAVFGGVIYLSNTRDSFDQYVFVSDSDTAPTSWSEVQIGSTFTGGLQPFLGGFVAGAALTLYFVVRNGATISTIYSSTLDGSWTSPALEYDREANPPAGLGSGVAGTLNPTTVDGADVIATDFVIGSERNAIFLAASGTVQNYCF